MDGVPHDERDPSEGETASTVSQWPNLGVGCACDIHKPTSSSSNLECLQLGRIHGSARLPASVAGYVYEVRQGGVPTCKEAPVITVAYFWHNERVFVGSSEAEVVCGGRPRAEVTGVGPEHQGATMKPGALHTNSEVATHSPRVTLPGTVQQLIRWGEAVRGDHVHREGIIELLQPRSKRWACDVGNGRKAAARDIAVGIGLVPVSNAHVVPGGGPVCYKPAGEETSLLRRLLAAICKPLGWEKAMQLKVLLQLPEKGQCFLWLGKGLKWALLPQRGLVKLGENP